MDRSIFLAQAFGLYLIVMGLVSLLRRGDLMAAVEQLAENRALVSIVSIFALILGLLVVLAHNLWVAGWPVLVTILGWLVLLKALAYLLLPFEAMAPLVRRFNTPAWHLGGGAASLLLGLFLAGKGFGLI